MAMSMAPSRSRALLMPLRRASTSTARCSHYPFPAIATRGRAPAAAPAAAAALSSRSASNYSTVANGAVTGVVAGVDGAGASGGRARLVGGVRSLFHDSLASSSAVVNDEIGDGGGTRYAEGPYTRMNLFTAVNAGLRTAMETDPTAVSRKSSLYQWF